MIFDPESAYHDMTQSYRSGDWNGTITAAGRLWQWLSRGGIPFGRHSEATARDLVSALRYDAMLRQKESPSPTHRWTNP